MKVVSPIVALATLASGASAAVDKDGASRPKRRTIFHNHKADDGSAEGEPDAGTDGRKRRQPGMNKMEKATKVNANRIIEQGLAMHRAAKKKEKEAAAAAAAEGDEERTLEGANPSDSSAAGDTPPGAATPLRSAEDADERETRTPAPATAPATAPAVTDKTPTAASGAALQGSGRAASFGFEEWEAGATAQELTKNRRRDRGFEFEQKLGRRRFTEEQMYGCGTTKTSDGDEKRGRRTASVAERKPNPRPVPRKSSASGKDRDFDERRRRRRDLRPGAPDSAKPGPPGQQDDRRDLKKSKKYSKSSKSKGGKSGDPNEDKCVVRLTNLTKEQWFSDIFWMVHSDKVEQPLWEFGLPAFDDLADLAQNGNPEPLIDFFDDNDDGVLAVDAERGPLMEGDSLFFDIPRSGSYDLFTMATSFIFSNDGFVSIDAGEIKDGAVWFLWGLDAGVEANTQLCWTVQATSADFPPNSDCFGVRDDVADQNDNGFFGEGFVFVHNGIHDFGNRNDLEDFLAFTCDELNANSFATYFRALGFDDGVLLYDDDRERNEKDDEVFLEDLEDEFDDLIDNFPAFKVAVDAGNFRQFCRDLNEINSFLVNAFETLEPQVFDFRTPMVRVEMAC